VEAVLLAADLFGPSHRTAVVVPPVVDSIGPAVALLPEARIAAPEM
jgi:hypothetical protein